MKNFFEIREQLDKHTSIVVEVVGLISIILLWSGITYFKMIPDTLLPAPWSVISSFGDLINRDHLFSNTAYSIKLNVLGYVEAVVISLLIGFPIGLFPVFRSLFSRYISASRFIPLTAIVGVFIAWFGIDTNMKVQFLAFGIIVYMLPVVIQRIDEVETVYLQTAKTLGCSKWQLITSVFFPAVLAKISDDIRVLVAISWTYIIVAELVNRSGGIGAMAYTAARQSRIDKVFAVLLVIIIIGFIQDRIFMWLDKKLFKFKYC